MTKVLIHGYKGRMGQALLACAANTADLEVAGRVDAGDDLAPVIGRADVVVDFSFHTATPTAARLCAEHGKALVVGTTGHTDEEKERIRACQTAVPIVWSANYSTGVNVLFWLTRQAAAALGPGYDAEIIELHHRLKKDAPSGTAATLAEILARVRGQQLSAVARHGRVGVVGERTAMEIGVHALRGGDVVGEHTVILATLGERLELTHKASNRETFAAGALRAAQWVVGRAPGLYNMQDVLGLK